jgi:hypothetical protein
VWIVHPSSELLLAPMIDGNDHPARQTGVVCIQVRNPNETKRVIEAILACLGRKENHENKTSV